MATISKRGSKWLAQVRRTGFPSSSRSFVSKTDAKAWATAQEAKIDDATYAPALRVMSTTRLADVIQLYLERVTPTKRSADTERLRLNKLLRDPLANSKLADLESRHIADYRNRRLKCVKAGTVRRELSLIHHALEMGRKEWGIKMPSNPVKEVTQPKLNNARDRRLEAGEAAALMAACNRSRCRQLLPIVTMAIESGMRRGEIVNLSWPHIDLERRIAHIPQTKTGKPRTIPLTDNAIAVLMSVSHRDGQVFKTTANAIKLAWTRAVVRSGLTNLRFHDLRHEAISRFFEVGLSLPEVALISGHRDPRMLFRYTHLRPENLALKLAGMSWSCGQI